MPTIYLHIGYPKCFSTTLQRSYFERHPQIHFGGVGIGDNISYANDEIELMFESLLKYGNKVYWSKCKDKAKENIQHFVEKSGNKKVVFSSEHLSMNFTLQGIANELKYRRLQYLFEKYDIKLLTIRRDPIKLIRSLYGEYVKMGYDQAYEAFLKWVITFQDRNFLVDLNYKTKDKQLKKWFGKDNVQWLAFEEIKEKDVENSLNKELTRWLETDDQHMDIANNNPSLDARQLAALRELNKKQQRGLNKRQTEPFERHRSRLVYDKSNIGYKEEEIFSEVIKKREALKWLKHENMHQPINFKQCDNLEEQIIKTVESYS